MRWLRVALSRRRHVKEIAPTDANARLGEFLTVDVRGPQEFDGPLGRVRGATLIPLPELETRARELPRDRALLLVCRSGARSAKACQQLEALGYGPATNLTGGMMAWNRAGLAVERAGFADAVALVDNALAWLAQVSAQTPAAVRAKLDAAVGMAAEVPETSDAARVLDWIEEEARAAGPPPDTDLSLAAFRSALATL
jgi:rhodanese-related sulfurtransferase